MAEKKEKKVNNIHEIKIEIKGEEWKKQIDNAFNKANKNAKIDGFRPGKAPREIYEKKYGKQGLIVDAVDNYMNEAYKKALDKLKDTPIITPNVSLEKADEESVIYKFIFTTKPEVKIKKYNGLNVKKETVKVTAKDVDEEIEKLRKEYSDLAIKDGKIEEGNTAIIDFEGFIDDKAFKGGKGENYPLEIGSHSFIPGFEEALIGLKAGDEKDVNVTFPKDYQAEEFQGKKAIFKVKIHEVKEKVFPELNEDFFMDLGLEDVKTKEDLKKVIKEQMTSQKEYENYNKYIDSLFEALLNETEVEVPHELIHEELDEMFLENNIILEDKEDIDLVSYNKARFYPISRGIIKSFEEYNDKYVYIAVDGIDRCKEVLEEIDILENVFLEINTCRSSCVGGPCRINTNGKAITANSKVRKYVRENTNKTTLNDLTINIDKQYSKIDINDNIPSEQDIQRILNMTNKYNKEDELNCGACGYDTCRQKAWAIYNGYADINMCLPYMRQRAESLSNEVMKSSPNGIVVIDDEYHLVEINDKAKEYLNIKNVKLGDSTIFEHFSDIDQLVNAIENNSNLNNQLTYINDNKKYLDYSLTLMPEQNLFLMVIKDVTAKTNYDKQLERIKSDTLALTDDVINKQMKVVQEIASLLGETTAETKAAIYNLKKTFKGDE